MIAPAYQLLRCIFSETLAQKNLQNGVYNKCPIFPQVDVSRADLIAEIKRRTSEA